MSESSLPFDAEVADHQLIFRAGQVEAVVVPLEEYRALKALEQRETELYWVAHESRNPSRPGDDVPDGNVYDSMERWWPISAQANEVCSHAWFPDRPASPA